MCMSLFSCVCGFFFVWPLLCLFLFRANTWGLKASDWLYFLLLFWTYKITYEEAVITADTAKTRFSLSHPTKTHTMAIAKTRVTKSIILGQWLWFSVFKKGSLNERAAVLWGRGKPQNRILVTPSRWEPESFITGNLFNFSKHISYLYSYILRPLTA